MLSGEGDVENRNRRTMETEERMFEKSEIGIAFAAIKRKNTLCLLFWCDGRLVLVFLIVGSARSIIRAVHAAPRLVGTGCCGRTVVAVPRDEILREILNGVCNRI